MKTEWKHRILLSSVWLSIPISMWYSYHIGDWTMFWGSWLVAQFHKVLGNNIGFHRYFSHRNFQTTEFKHKLLVLWTIFLASKSPIVYALNHRHHHLYADTNQDTHSPVQSFWQTVTGAWEFRGYKWFSEKGIQPRVKDLMRDPVIRWFDKNYFKIWIFMSVVTLLIDWRIFLFFLLLPAGHYHWGVNLSLTIHHLKIPGSYRSFNTPDNSHNHHWLAWLTLGEGYHNNHHHNPNSYYQSLNKGEFDICGWFVDKFFIIKNENHKPYTF
jgi:stearoyl-CoA desaturase (delta-9 desaturase)